MIDVPAILDLHETTVARWHEREIDNPYEGFLRLVCEQHERNFRLWHQEDIARSPSVTDAEIAGVKRAIDKLNQQRNDLIERLDDFLLAELAAARRRAAARGPAEHRNAGQRDRPALDHRACGCITCGSRPPALTPRGARRQGQGPAGNPRGTAPGPVELAGRVAGRHLRRPQAAEGLPSVQDVQRPDDESVSLRGKAAGRREFLTRASGLQGPQPGIHVVHQ